MPETYSRDRISIEILSSLMAENTFVKTLLKTDGSKESIAKNKKLIKSLAAYSCFAADSLILVFKEHENNK